MADISIHAPLAESDANSGPHQGLLQYFYPRSPCGERQYTWILDLGCNDISIHAPLAESDVQLSRRTLGKEVFLSTLPLRRATERQPLVDTFSAFLSTLPLRRATGPKLRQLLGALISIHAPLAESDAASGCINFLGLTFLSTLPLRRATLMRYRIKAR